MARFDIESNINEVTGAFGNFASGLTGPVRAAIGTVNTALATLAANPIGAVVAALGIAFIAVANSLRQLQPVIDEVDVALARLSAGWSFIVDTVGSYLGIADAPVLSFRETISAAGDLERATIAAADANIQLIVTSAELRVEQREQLTLAADQTRSIEERLEALNAADVATRSLFDAQRLQLDEEIRVLEAQQALGSNTRADNEELARLQAQRIDLNAMEAGMLMAIVAQQSSLTNQVNAQAQAQRDRDQAALDGARELRQEREIDLAIAGGSTEEEVFQLRLERAETQAEMDDILHERELFRIRELRQEQMEADTERMEMDQQVADIAQATADGEAEAVAISEQAKREAVEATTSAAINALTGLLGESKGAQIAGLIAQNAFEAFTLVRAGARGAAEATIAANAAAVPTLGASVAALPAQLAGITASTTSGLLGIGIATAGGIAGILSSPGASPSVSGSATTPSGPTVTTPTIAAGTAPEINNTSETDGPQRRQQAAPPVLLTPRSGPGSLEATMRNNNRRNSRRQLNRNTNGS